nr:hypothetical protein [uncultured Flavobacterium sp.]
MNEPIIIAPTLADASTVVIYRSNGEEIVVKLYKEKGTLASEKKLIPEEVNFIKENYL